MTDRMAQGRNGKINQLKGTRSAAAKSKRQAHTALPPNRLTASRIISLLKAAYPDARCALEHRNAYQLLCATILSAQCTDARVNMVTPALFGRYPTPFELARATPADVEEIIKSTGFFRNKTRSLIGMAQAVVADHGGEVPLTMEELRKLPGVGRKTANVVLGNAFGMNEGVTVDTHVTRLSGLLGLSRETDPVKIERDLMDLFPRNEWGLLSHLLIFHGRQVCIARRPRCGDCVLAHLCPSSLI
ncbi:MAG: endonuclease III [Gemmatimonadota bacterium]|nr:endonuclease III [Gemmatimonadota bacterium]